MTKIYSVKNWESVILSGQYSCDKFRQLLKSYLDHFALVLPDGYSINKW